jgi:hypothetical protein
MNNTIAKTILNQMGGINRISAMTGAFNFLEGKNEVRFKFKGSKKANHVRVQLDADDTYTVTFSKIRGLKFAEVAKFSGIYNDGLIDLFERTTELYLSL